MQRYLLIFLVNLLFFSFSNASVVIIYLSGNKIIFTSDSRNYNTSNGIVKSTTDTFCKIRIVEKFGIAMVGTIEGNGPIKYDAWSLIGNAFNTYSYDTAIVKIKTELSTILRNVGDNLSKTDIRYSLATKIDGPVILSFAVARNINRKLELQMIHFGYLKDEGVSKIKVYDFLAKPKNESINYYMLGVERTNLYDDYIRNNFNINDYGSMKKIVDFVSFHNPAIVGGDTHILVIDDHEFKWRPNDNCR